MQLLSRSRFGAVLALLMLGACSSTSATTADAGTAARTVTTATSASSGRVLHWTNAGPPLALGAPFCKAKRCVFPWTETGTFHGDLEGTHVSAGAAALDSTGKHFAVGRTDLFVGTVRGCGKGTLVLIGSEDATATGGTGAEKIAVGYGTGALAHVTGSGTGVGTAGANGIRSTFTGEIDCK